MGYGSRYFLVEQDGTLKHIPHRVVDGLYRREDRVPEYAGLTVRIAVAELVVEDRRPTRVHQILGQIWKFDSLGRFDEEFQDALSRNIAASLSFGIDLGGNGTIVSFPAKIARRELRNKFQWKPTPTELTRIVHAIWPETADRPIKRPKTITGVKKRPRP